MKYQARQLTPRLAAQFNADPKQWAVYTGRRLWKKSIGTQAHAESEACRMSAQWYIRQAEQALKGVQTVESVRRVASSADYVVGLAVDKLREIDPEFDEFDPRAFLA